jgi:long-chain acyl-CoA synthetase
VASLLEMSEKVPGMKAIISMDSLQEVPTAPNTASAPKVLRAWAAGKGIQLFDFAEIEALGILHPHKHLLPTENEVASLCYTSGTTGQPVCYLLL